MVFNRIYDPNDDDIFYHYCSADTFLAICQNKNLRFSDANMLNDYEEGRWGYSRFEDAASRLINDDRFDIDEDFCRNVDNIISEMQFHSHPVICSLSKSPDVLSQWRNYADNGRGFAVGFSGKALKRMPVTILDVEYDTGKQVDEICAALLTINEIYKNGNNRSEFFENCSLLAANLYAYKNKLFSEENEIRLIHLLSVKKDGERSYLIDDGGESDGKSVPGVEVKYRINSGAIVAYIDISLTMPLESVIKSVWLGPKNDNGPGNIFYPLNHNGFSGFDVNKSKASYR